MAIGMIQQQHKILREGMTDCVATQAGQLLELVASPLHLITIVVAAQQVPIGLIEVFLALLLLTLCPGLLVGMFNPLT